MAPCATTTTTTTTSRTRRPGNNDDEVTLSTLELANLELKQLQTPGLFPTHCRTLLYHITGNHRCIDCRAHNPQWAAVRYGALVCLQCSGNHRSLGVQVSSVRSIAMDEWTATEVLSMLEGGNRQMEQFFQRHCLTEETYTEGKIAQNVRVLRYKTKAALFYRRHLERHVQSLLEAGPYRGRETSRQQRASKDRESPHELAE